MSGPPRWTIRRGSFTANGPPPNVPTAQGFAGASNFGLSRLSPLLHIALASSGTSLVSRPLDFPTQSASLVDGRLNQCFTSAAVAGARGTASMCMCAACTEVGRRTAAGTPQQPSARQSRQATKAAQWLLSRRQTRRPGLASGRRRSVHIPTPPPWIERVTEAAPGATVTSTTSARTTGSADKAANESANFPATHGAQLTPPNTSGAAEARGMALPTVCAPRLHNPPAPLPSSTPLAKRTPAPSRGIICSDEQNTENFKSFVWLLTNLFEV
eukprot:GHVT01100670.1.p1 GENE.GHVT01100670.1~~GHVT01100670.1.p1  ORF type:complete len:271 (+),score=39.48 GHVT01100670.1:394-1206(+)